MVTVAQNIEMYTQNKQTIVNAVFYAVPEEGLGSARVVQHRWGQDVAALGGPFDVIVACGKPMTVQDVN